MSCFLRPTVDPINVLQDLPKPTVALDLPELPQSLVSPESFIHQALEDSQMSASLEASPSLAVCGNIHQSRYFPFWKDVLQAHSCELVLGI